MPSMLGIFISGRAFRLVRNIRQHVGRLCKTAGADIAADDACAIGPHRQDDVVSFKAYRL